MADEDKLSFEPPALVLSVIAARFVLVLTAIFFQAMIPFLICIYGTATCLWQLGLVDPVWLGPMPWVATGILYFAVRPLSTGLLGPAANNLQQWLGETFTPSMTRIERPKARKVKERDVKREEDEEYPWWWQEGDGGASGPVGADSSWTKNLGPDGFWDPHRMEEMQRGAQRIREARRDAQRRVEEARRQAEEARQQAAYARANAQERARQAREEARRTRARWEDPFRNPPPPPPPRTPPPSPPRGQSPYEILGVLPTASTEEIKATYREQIRKNHPDRVMGLSKELQDLALLRSKQINQAWDAICKERGII